MKEVYTEKPCVICLSKINKKDNYFEVKLFIKGKLFGIDYAHQKCWLKRNNMSNQIKNLVSGAGELLNKAREDGIIKKEVIVL